MLRGNESISHYNPANVAIWMAMAFQAGALNIGGFMACHTMVSHVTGYATLFGFEVVSKNIIAATGALTVPLFFLLGSILSGLLVDIRLKLHKRPKYYLLFGVMTVLILVIYVGGVRGYFGEFGEPLASTRDYVLLALICLVCGLQNGAITTVSRAVVRTTHLTGLTTDLGIGIVRVLYKNKVKDGIGDEVKANYMRVGIIFFFALGSTAAGFVFYKNGYRGFLAPAVTSGALFLITYYYQRIKAHQISS